MFVTHAEGWNSAGLNASRPAATPKPMSVDAAITRKIARLSRIGIADAEVEPLAAELNGILGWIEQLAEVDVTGIEPMTAVMPIALRWRDDVVSDGDAAVKVLANAPDARHGFFAVPKVIE